MTKTAKLDQNLYSSCTDTRVCHRKDVDAFTLNKENRLINRAHLRDIKEQWKKTKDKDLMPAITVNVVTGNVFDGQHRLCAYKELVDSGELPPNTPISVKFISMSANEERSAIIDANTNSKNWCLDDFIKSYAKAGYDSYEKLKSWCESHSLARDANDSSKCKFRYGAAIITGKNCQNELKNCSFTITDDQLIEAEATHAQLVEIINSLGLNPTGHYIEALAISWIYWRDRIPCYDFMDWKRELKKQRKQFTKHPLVKKCDWDSVFKQVLAGLTINRSITPIKTDKK